MLVCLMANHHESEVVRYFFLQCFSCIWYIDAGDGSAAENSSEGPSTGTSNDEPGQAKSLKCDE